MPRLLTSEEAYARWSAAYPPHAHNALMQLEQEAMLSLLPSLQQKVVLDLGCGTGRYSQLAAEQKAGRVLAMDNSREMLMEGRRARAINAPIQAGLDAIPLAEQSVDVVVCALAIGHVKTVAPVLAELSRVLRAGGTALLSDFHPFLFLSGKQRTFTANGKTFAVEHYAHLYATLHAAAAQAHLRIDAILEPMMTVDQQQQPAVIVYRLRK
ncbi:MAG: class I SAM-dependent methyltransferase [bacterium]|nr:class I SAM-dependent methyltransferase [bacterium]